jgi:hypothetical protein
VEAGTGYGENSILHDMRKEKIFKKKTSLGVVFASHFQLYRSPPLLWSLPRYFFPPLSFLSLLILSFLLKLQHCNSEFSTSRFVAAEFTEEAMRKDYVTHLKDIQH